MTATSYDQFDSERDLILEREVDVPLEMVWAAWTRPEQIVKWFAPLPWTTSRCEIDLRPGGYFRSTMVSPEGKEFPGEGCFLEIIPNKLLAWTDALEPGYRPSEKPFFTAVITLEPHGKNGTKYRVHAKHKDSVTKKQHEDMGFLTGWGACLDQMVAMIKAKQA